MNPQSPRDWENECRQRYIKDFKNHEAEVLDGSPLVPAGIQLLKWRNPKSSICAMNAIIYGGTLMVHGDLYESIYRWSGSVTFKWIAGIDFGYFHSKLRAASTAASCWSQEVGMHRLKEMLTQYEEDSRTLKVLKPYIEDLMSYEAEKGECERIAVDVYGELDGEIASEIAQCGKVPDRSCIGHHAGIVCAVKWLENNASK